MRLPCQLQDFNPWACPPSALRAAAARLAEGAGVALLQRAQDLSAQTLGFETIRSEMMSQGHARAASAQVAAGVRAPRTNVHARVPLSHTQARHAQG
jgi:hypothetical protein